MRNKYPNKLVSVPGEQGVSRGYAAEQRTDTKHLGFVAAEKVLLV